MGRKKSFFTKKNMQKLYSRYGELGILGVIFLDFGTPLCVLGIFLNGFIFFGVLFVIIGVLCLVFGYKNTKCNSLQTKNKTIKNNLYSHTMSVSKKPRTQTKTIYDKQEITPINFKTFTNKELEEIDCLTGIEFEKYLCVLFVKLGYAVKLTKASGDYGVDLILEKYGQKSIVQAKRYAKKVSVSAVQEISTAKSHYDIYSAIIVTNNYFTESAKTLAKENNIDLYDRNKLKILIAQANDIDTTTSESKIPIYKDNIYDKIQQVNYDNNFLSNIYAFQKSFINAINTTNIELVNEHTIKLFNIPINSKQDYISYHFCLTELVKHLYKYRDTQNLFIDVILKICSKDIEVLQIINKELSNTSVTTLSKMATILEKKKRYAEIIEICNFAIKYNFYEENHASFSIRLEKIKKKMENMENT